VSQIAWGLCRNVQGGRPSSTPANNHDPPTGELIRRLSLVRIIIALSYIPACNLKSILDLSKFDDKDGLASKAVLFLTAQITRAAAGNGFRSTLPT